jgi:glycosyltransferase involved in cell wall biosynthesis
VLQPTRIVPRKRIELAIELVRRLEMPAVLVVTHAAGDEGSGYEKYLRDSALRIGVPVRFVSDHIRPVRGAAPDGKRVYSLSDAYHQADLVTYPSQIEGFGNAFLETIHHRLPIVLSTYEIFRTDIQPKGFRVIGFDEYIGDDTVLAARQVLSDLDLRREIGDHNYELGRRYYSFQVLEELLKVLVTETLGL